MSEYLNFERDLLNQEIKANKKYIFIILSVLILNSITLGMNLAVFNHNYFNIFFDGCLSVSTLYISSELVIGLMQLKELIRRKSVYAEFDVKHRLNPLISVK